MTTVSVLGSGLMATALAFPLSDNGHEVRLIGTHLDREIIDSIKERRVHPGLDLEVPLVVKAFQLEEAEEAFDGADVVMSGVNSFGVRWAGERLVTSIKVNNLANKEVMQHIFGDIMKRQVVGELRFTF